MVSGLESPLCLTSSLIGLLVILDRFPSLNATDVAAESPLILKTSGRGNLDNISWQPTDRPAPGEGQVEVRVRVTGLNFRDVMNAMNMYPDAEKLNIATQRVCLSKEPCWRAL